MVVHIFLQTFGTVAAIILAVIPLVDSQSMGIKENAPHSYIGIALLVLLIIQLTLGIFNWQVRIRMVSRVYAKYWDIDAFRL